MVRKVLNFFGVLSSHFQNFEVNVSNLQSLWVQIVVDFEGPNDLEKVTLILSVSNPKNALRIKIFKNFQNRAN